MLQSLFDCVFDEGLCKTSPNLYEATLLVSGDILAPSPWPRLASFCFCTSYSEVSATHQISVPRAIDQCGPSRRNPRVASGTGDCAQRTSLRRRARPQAVACVFRQSHLRPDPLHFFSPSTTMPISTALTNLLHIRTPFVGAAMQWVSVPRLVAAVSNAGGLGVLTALTQPNPEALRQAIRETRSLTSKPFGVNITLLPSINPPDYAGYARAAVEEGVRIFETAGNNPGKIIKYLKENGCIVIHKCTTIRHAKSAAKHGVDVLSIDGFECAGHPGEDDIGGLVLLARAAKELDIPYIASGGIADARGIAAALALGAAGVNMGTRFMCTVESPIHHNIKQKIVDSSEQDTTHIFRTLHNTARVFKNKVAQEVVTIERRGNAKFEDIRDLVSGARGRIVYENGDPDYGIWTAGIAMGLITDIPTCEALISRLEKETEAIIGNMAALVVTKAKL
uniref:2-nitropropane dioxygenase n=1 Tax=Mycena chlorophos TaxID=658473 RepID=A0ABQ0MDV3_MYCCL|nr:2-nitropropane dioxygenase [Mycena chlorophos]